jgi:SAM-dependent methyltransferase
MRQLDRLGHDRSSLWALFAADGYHLPFKDRSFDVVICSEVLEHVGHPHRIARQLNRVIKPNGRLAVSVPRFFPERLCWRLSQTYAGTEGGHIRIFRKTELLDLFHQQGFTAWSSHFAHSLHTPYWWLKCALGSNTRFHGLIEGYHRFLVWDIMHAPPLTRKLDKLFNPVLGKSLVVYFNKGGSSA